MSNRDNCKLKVARTVDPVFQKPLKFVERLTTIINSSLFGFNEARRTFQDTNAVDLETSELNDDWIEDTCDLMAKAAVIPDFGDHQ